MADLPIPTDPSFDFNFKNELVPELLSIHALNSFTAYNSPSRGVMFSGHFAQRLVHEGSEPKITKTGAEYEMGKYAMAVRMPEDGTIEAVIQRYPRGIGEDRINFNPETIVIYRRHVDGIYDYFSIPYMELNSPSFGFSYQMTDAFSGLSEGAVFEKDQIFAKTPALRDDGEYTYSINANMAYMSHPSTSLDGYMVSSDILKGYKFKIYETRTVMFGANTMPLNINGDDEEYKAFPDIGDYTREDGLIFAMRRNDVEYSPICMSEKDLQEVDYMFDNKIYGRPMRGRVVDLTIFGSDNVNYQLSEKMTKQLNKYSRAHRRFYQNILNFKERALGKLRARDRLAELPTTPKLQRLLVKARAITNQPNAKANLAAGKSARSTSQPLTYSYRQEPLDAWRATIVIEYEVTPTRGFKFTCQHGGICLPH